MKYKISFGGRRHFWTNDAALADDVYDAFELGGDDHAGIDDFEVLFGVLTYGFHAGGVRLDIVLDDRRPESALTTWHAG